MDIEFIKNIGQGGFGKVDEVQVEKFGVCARKTFLINQGAGFSEKLASNVKKRFIREANVQGAISHVNIVPILDKFLDAKPPFFLMPLAKSSMEDDMRVSKTLDGNFMNAIMDIIAGMEELHSMDIFHRDLKPANILRFGKGKKQYYAVGDFGLMSVNQTTLSALTQAGMKMGSDYYTAPEIVKELKNASAQSDIYSIGCILHDFIGEEERIPCGEINEKGDFGGIFLNCTRRDPNRRFKSVTMLRDALLSLGDVTAKATTEQGAEISLLFEKGIEELTEDDWKSIVNFVEDEYDSEDSIVVLRKLSLEHIDHVLKNHPAIGSKMGLLYAKWIRENNFNFEECDGLSIRLHKFINNCGIEVQSECLMAMLYLGTDHNRWYVERKFVSITDEKLDTNLAKRLGIEIIVDGRTAKRAFKHLGISISFDEDNLHPILRDALNKIS
ncbi:MAG: protein kinase [Labilibaculum sp.]|nr:protein kinase [Labilibaculum sp.]MBI9056813.1 protein kinase [Labilibaculum sp.]